MQQFLFTRVISTHREPSEDFLSPHFLDVNDGEHETHAGQVELDDLKDEGLVVLGIEHRSAD